MKGCLIQKAAFPILKQHIFAEFQIKIEIFKANKLSLPTFF